ncbi:MAG: hypothetical protein AAGI44_03470, partial [Pseudomonadota bacterium]
RYPIDSDGIVLVGESNGGMLAYRAAARLKPRVAGIAVIAGAMFTGQEAPSPGVSAWIFHGGGDRAIPPSGGYSEVEQVRQLQTAPFLTMAEALGFWMTVNQCSGSEVETSADRLVATTRGADCSGGARVESWRSATVAHGWPKGAQLGDRSFETELHAFISDVVGGPAR